MLRSMFSAISGLKAHQTKLDVTANNIANVNTVGYKSQTAVFEAALSQLIRSGGTPGAGTGGSNPAQIGLGVNVAGISTNWKQGATQSTGRSSDFLIEGDGFFVVQSGSQQLFTRSGSFGFDAAGNMITDSGAILQGWRADATGAVNTNSAIGDLAIPFGGGTAPKATTGAVLSGNLSAAAATGTVVEKPVTMYDDLGKEQVVNATFTKTSTANTWTMKAKTGSTDLFTSSGTSVEFDATGNLTKIGGTAATSATVAASALPTGWTGPLAIDLSAVTQYGSPTTIAVGSQNGYGAGTLDSFSLSNDGVITGAYSNGQTKVLGQLALANFANPGGLEKAGASTYRPASNSGLALIGLAGTGGRGLLTAGALEMSNVDLSEEFTGLIVAQRGFQANSRVITSSDEVLQDLVNLKR